MHGEVVQALINKGRATINFNNYLFQHWQDFRRKEIYINIKPIPIQVKPEELQHAIADRLGVSILDTNYMRHGNQYLGYIQKPD